MRILINTLATKGGGGITYLENILPLFAESEHEYIVLVPESRNKPKEPKDSNIRFKVVGKVADQIATRILYEQLTVPYLITKLDIDILFCPEDLAPLLAPSPVLLAIRNPNPYFSAAEFNLDRPLSRRLKFRLQRFLTGLSARKADHVFFVSDYSKQITNEYFDLPDTKTHTIYHGMNKSLFTDPKKPSNREVISTAEDHAPFLLTVSAVTEHKNYEVLLRGYGQLPSEIRSEYPLLIAGPIRSESYFDRLQQIITQNGIEENIIFLGGVEYEYIPYVYSQAKLYILPSKLETFGHTLIEAMASGVPVIAANSTCIPEITGGAAQLFDPDDGDDLANQIAILLNDTEKWEKRKQNGLHRADDFSWERTFKQTESLLEELGQK